MIGPGKYDDVLTKVRLETEANGAILIILDGKQGFGFSAQLSPLLVGTIPALLRDVANQIEEMHKQGNP